MNAQRKARRGLSRAEFPSIRLDYLPPLRMTPAEFSALPEHSTAYPRDTTPGKRWRRLDGWNDLAFLAAGGKPMWMVMEYGEISADGKSILLKRWRPIIIIPRSEASSAPAKPEKPT